MDLLTLLRQEINMTQGQENDMAKWKLAITAALGAAALGLTKDAVHPYWLLLFVPFVCAYVDLYAYQYQLRILVIAKYFRDQAKARDLKEYEDFVKCVRDKHGFELGNWAGLGSSVGASFLVPALYLAALKSGSAQITLLIPPVVAFVIWLLGMSLVLYLNYDFQSRRKKIDV